MNIKDVGKNIERIRKLRGLSQRDLSLQAKVSPRIISYYEKEASNEFLDILQKIANALKVNLTDLLGVSDNNTTKSEASAKEELDFSELDTRFIKKVKQLLKLSPQERSVIYKMIEGAITNKKVSNY